MRKHYLHIALAILLLNMVVSCETEKKVFDPTSAKKQKKPKEALIVSKYNKLLKSNDSEAKLNAAIVYYNKKDYMNAFTLLESILTIYKGTAKGPEVQYYYACSNYYLKDYIIAGYQFRTFGKNYPDNEHTEFCAYMAALCYFQTSPAFSLDQTDTESAIKEFQRFLNLYPKSQYKADCEDKLDRLTEKLVNKSYKSALLYYNMGSYKAAVVSFKNHIKDFPESKHVEESYFLIVKANYLLAINSVEIKKEERLKQTVDSYLKFAGEFPNSSYLKDAQKMYSEVLTHLERYKKLT